MIAITHTAGKRRGFLLLLLLTLGYCLYSLGLKSENFIPHDYGLTITKEFFSAALSPALDYQSEGIPEDAPPYFFKILKALWLTLQYATCAISLALPIGLFFGFFASRSWWMLEKQPFAIALLTKALHRFSKLLITAGRSIHEVLWALLFMTALGTSPFAIIVALAIPYGCTLAKVFSELLDEQSDHPKRCLQSQGGGAFSSWFFGVFPIAIPDLLSYTLYRYECAIRSAAILGFVGIPTIGYHIETAVEDGFMNEVWTLLYALILLILVIERWSSAARKRLVDASVSMISPAELSVTALKQVRPRKTFLKISLGFCAALTCYAWTTGEPLFSTLSWEQRLKNIDRFLNKEITPYPVQQSGEWADAIPWAKDLLLSQGIDGAQNTLYIATAAMILAFFAGLVVLPFSSKNLNRKSPFGIYTGHALIVCYLRKGSASLLRGLFILSRSMPEFLLAYLLLQMLDATAWPLILGLALHNFGIVGRLGGELTDNAELNHSKVQIAQGGSRIKTFLFSILPAYFNRFVLYFFYRWETCVRDATVLGLLGINSLGFLIDEAKARDNYDEWFFYLLLSASIVMLGDFLSDIVRARLKAK